MTTSLPSEGIGSIPRPESLIDAFKSGDEKTIEEQEKLAIIDTISKYLEITKGQYPITDGEQTKSSFVTYPLKGLANLKPGGIVIPFEDGHTRQLPVLSSGPFEYGSYAVEGLKKSKSLAPSGTIFKQAVIAPSAITLLYPSEPLADYSREEFVNDVIKSAVKDIRSLFDEGVEIVQIDFTEGRLALKLDPSGGLLKSFLEVIEKVLENFTVEEKQRIGIHSCPGADHDSTHSADVSYEQLLPDLLNTSVGRFYLQLKSEKDPEIALKVIQKHIKPNQKVFIGVIDVNNRRVETVEEVAAFIELAAKYIPINQLGTTDDCGFSPFADDVSTARDLAFEKIKARIEGTKMASDKLSS